MIGKVREGCKMNDSFAHYSTKLTTNEMAAFRTYFVFCFWGLSSFFLLKEKYYLYEENIFFLINIFLTSGLLLPQISSSFFFLQIGLCTLMKNLQNRHMLLFTLKLSKVINCDGALLVFGTFFCTVSRSWDVCVCIYIIGSGKN